MEKRSQIRGISSEEVIERAKLYEKPTDSSLRRLRSLLPANLFITGISGKTYHFPMAGAEVNVDEQDVKEFLAKVIKNSSCCGGRTKELPLFEEVV